MPTGREIFSVILIDGRVIFFGVDNIRLIDVNRAFYETAFSKATLQELWVSWNIFATIHPHSASDFPASLICPS